jgi:ATP-dependent RNA helicase DeaD
MPAEVARIGKNSWLILLKYWNQKQVQQLYLTNFSKCNDRYEALKRLADANPDIFSVVFCRTKRDTLLPKN